MRSSSAQVARVVTVVTFRPLVVLAVCLVAVGATSARAQTIPDSAMQSARGPLERELLADVADGRLDRFSLLAAALTVSGADDWAQVRTLEQQFQQAIAPGLVDLQTERNDARRAIAALKLLHRQVLRGSYDADGDNVITALQGGRYNCVAATTLYEVLAEAAALPVVATVMPGHVVARVQLSDHELLIDATSAEGFEHIWPANAAITRHREVRRLDQVQLVSLLYYNRAVDELAQRDFAAAYAAGMKANFLDSQHRAARTNLIATLNNWAIDRLQAERWDDAERLLQRGLQLADNEPTLRHNLTLLEARRRDVKP
ncbi:MAG: hypothetical protein JSS27_16020 [Planctomycetes bacterium]|nr:hypothetical protein [Planctomycetota bacterium]